MIHPVKLFGSFFHPFWAGNVKLIVSGSASDYNITFKGSEDHANQLPHARKGWRYAFTASEGDYVYFSAQANEPGAQVQVKILYKGRVFRESTASGDFALAYAGGCLC